MIKYAVFLTINRNSDIIISFIGDVNQAIYGGLGGVAKTKEEIITLFEQNFTEKHLTGCYRSIQHIVDYYSNYAVNKIEIESIRADSEKDAIISFEDSVSKEELADHVAELVKERLAQGEKEEIITEVGIQTKKYHYYQKFKMIM